MILRKTGLRGAAALFLSLAMLSGSVCLGAEAGGETVHATLWDERYITVDATPICTADENDRFHYPLAYNGSVYIPLQTASEWLGAWFEYDEAAGTITLGRALGKAAEPYYRHWLYDQPPVGTKEEQKAFGDQYDYDKEHGVEMELRPDIRVILDGEAQTFTNAAGEETPPALFRGVFFLPVRGVAQMCGKEITFLPGQTAAPEVRGNNVTDFSLLFEPLLTYYEQPDIFLYDKPTKAQLDEVQAFLDEAERLLYEGPIKALEEFLACEGLSDEECITWLREIGDTTDTFFQLPQPEAPFFASRYKFVLLDARHIRTYGTDTFIDAMKRGVYNFNSLTSEDALPHIITHYLYLTRVSISWGQEMLDAVRAQMGL